MVVRIAYARIVPYRKDPRVDAYIDPLPAWQQRICHRLRDLVHAADPAVEETIKRRVQPYFVLERTGLRHPHTVARLGADSYGFVADWHDRLADELEREAG